MAANSWPATLPQLVSVVGYRERPPQTVVRTQMDVGPDKIRQRSSAGTREVQGELDLTEAQVEILDDFFVNDLSHGALDFDWVDPRNQAAYELRFVNRPTYQPVGSSVAWTASIQLEIMP